MSGTRASESVSSVGLTVCLYVCVHVFVRGHVRMRVRNKRTRQTQKWRDRKKQKAERE